MPLEKLLDTEECISVMLDLWTLLTESQQTRIRECMKIVGFRKHELIYREGENPDFLMCVLRGKVKIYRDGVGGRSQIMRVLRPGQYFGYRASLAAEPYVTAAAAFESSQICLIPMQIVKTVMQENNAFCMFFIRELATDLGISDKRTVSLTQKHIRGRLAESILYLADNYGYEADNETIAIQVTREELSQIANMTTANAIRTLSTFIDEGLVATHGRVIQVKNKEVLRRISSVG